MKLTLKLKFLGIYLIFLTNNSKLPKHKNIVTLIGVVEFPVEGLAIVTEWIGSSLQNALRQQKFEFLEKLECCFQIAQGIKFFHEQNVIHRNLSSENCCVVIYCYLFNLLLVVF